MRETLYHGLAFHHRAIIPFDPKIVMLYQYFYDKTRQGSYFTFYQASFKAANTNLPNFTKICDCYHVLFVSFTIICTKFPSETIYIRSCSALLQLSLFGSGKWTTFIAVIRRVHYDYRLQILSQRFLFIV